MSTQSGSAPFSPLQTSGAFTAKQIKEMAEDALAQTSSVETMNLPALDRACDHLRSVQNTVARELERDRDAVDNSPLGQPGNWFPDIALPVSDARADGVALRQLGQRLEKLQDASLALRAIRDIR